MKKLEKNLKKFLTRELKSDKINFADSPKGWSGNWSLKTEQLILNYPKLILKFKKRTIKITMDKRQRNLSDKL